MMSNYHYRIDLSDTYLAWLREQCAGDESLFEDQQRQAEREVMHD